MPAPEPRRLEDEELAGLAPGELELAGAMLSGCRFRDCDLTEASLRGTHLSECVFEGCELAMVDLADALLHWTRFEDCRLTGVRFGAVRRDAVGIGMELERCDLTLASFRELDLRGCAFRGCLAREAEFVDCDLRGVSFEGTDLARATFRGSNLGGADLRAARNYAVSACDNRVRGMRVTLPEAIGLLGALGLEVEG